MPSGRSAKGQLILGGALFFGILAAAVGTDVALLVLLALGPLVTVAVVLGLLVGPLESDSIGGLLLACLFSLLTVLALGAAALGVDPQFRNLVVMFGIVTDFLAGLGAVMAVRVAEDTERPTPGPPHGF
jgi:hypothetical protein